MWLRGLEAHEEAAFGGFYRAFYSYSYNVRHRDAVAIRHALQRLSVGRGNAG